MAITKAENITLALFFGWFVAYGIYKLVLEPDFKKHESTRIRKNGGDGGGCAVGCNADSSCGGCGGD